MKKTLNKFLLRKIKRNLSGFITISIIVALGVGFLVGLLLTTPDLQATIDTSYDETNVADLTLKSTIGFDDNAINKIQEIYNDDLQFVEGSYQMDEHVYSNDERLTARTIYYNFEGNINRINILEGEIPDEENEILVERPSTFYKEFNIGDTIIVGEKEYNVSGIAANPQYFSKEKEYTTVSPGKLDTIIYFNNLFNPNDFYTDINIIFKGSDEFNTFSDDYFDFINNKKSIIKANENELLESRYASLSIQIEEQVREEMYKQLVEMLGETLAEELMKTELVQNEINVIIEEQLSLLDAKLYILNRNDNTSFHIYSIESTKTNEVAIVFPFFFIAIATLITLSTLERMIKEDRIYIGTLKSLGYTNSAITGCYTGYTMFATSIGVTLGTGIGVVALPFIIHLLFSDLFFLPLMVFTFNPILLIATVLGIVLAVLIASLCTLQGVLKEKPNALLTQKPIKSGGKILLERIKFIWNKLKFKYKSTIRNLFRFKKNALLMIVGIAGSTALVLGALGIGDSIRAVTETQYNDIIIYNTVVKVDNIDENPFENFDNVVASDLIYRIDSVAEDDEDFDVEIFAPYNETDLNNYIHFIQDGKEIEFNDDSIFISSQLSEMLGLKVGDVFFFLVEEKQYSVLINGVVENHLNNYLYLSETIFKNVFKDQYEPNCYLGIANDINTIELQEKFINQLSENDNVKEVILTYQNKQTYDNLLNTLQLLIIVLILFSGLLQICSIYSLTNINVSERSREIATLKVLGYRRREVCGYIYRETSILALIGIFAGFFLGYLFHRFVVVMMQMPGLSIGFVISPLTYLYAFIVSAFFFILVDLIFLPKINNLSMIESLKSVE